MAYYALFTTNGVGHKVYCSAHQTFTPSATNLCTAIYLSLGINPGQAATTATITLQPVDGGGEPTGEILATMGVITDAQLTTTMTWKTFNSDSVELTGSIEYAIVITLEGASICVSGETTDCGIRWERASSYAGGVGREKVCALNGAWACAVAWTNIIGDFNFIQEGSVAPSKPTNPTPADTDTGVDFSGRVLDWDDGGGADTFDVYVGPTGALVKVANAIAPSTYTVDLEDVPTDQVIYWRVDATNGAGTTTGDTWSFDARPVKANTPSPTDAVSDITLDETPLGWTDGGNADTYNVYFGESGSEALVASLQAGVEWTITFGLLDYNTTYGWRIDSVNDFGTTTGDIWTFDSITFDTILPGTPGVGGGGGGGGSGEENSPTGENNMITLRRLVAAANSKIWFEDV